MAIEITKEASKYAALLHKSEVTSKTADDASSLGFRLYLAGKSCDGFQYGICFDQAQASDKKIPFGENAFDLLIDPDSIPYLENVEISYVDDERGKGFWVENLDQRSFRGKFFKRKSWRTKLEKTSHRADNS